MQNDENNLNDELWLNAIHLHNDYQISGVPRFNPEVALGIFESLVEKIAKSNESLSDTDLIKLNSAAWSVVLEKKHRLNPLLDPLRDIVKHIGMGIEPSEVKKQVIALIKSGSGNKKYKVPISTVVSNLQLWKQKLMDNLIKEVSNDEPRGEITSNMITHYMLIGEILFQMGKHIHSLGAVTKTIEFIKWPN